MRISALSREYIHVAVTAADVDGVAVDPTTDTVEIAVIATGTTVVSGDFNTADWGELGSDPYVAKVLIGPGGSPSIITLTAGSTYDVYVRITDTPEIPVMFAYSIDAY